MTRYPLILLAVLCLLAGTTASSAPAIDGSPAVVPSPTSAKSVDSRDQDGYTALMRAARSGEIQAMQAQLTQGADVHARSPRGSTPLMFAVEGGLPAVNLLLSKGARIDEESANGMTALAWAVSLQRPEVFGRLLAAGADPQHLLANRQTLLHMVAKSGLPSVAKILLERGVKPDATDIYNETALIFAAKAGQAEVVRVLAPLSERSHRNAYNETALTLACTKGHREVVKALLDAGVPISGPEGDKAIANAVEAKQFALTLDLIDRGANVNARGFLGRPLISLAAWAKQPALALLLLVRHADPNLKSESDETPLQMVTGWTEAPGLVGMLLNSGVHADTTSLLNACGTSRPEIVALLLKAGADVSATEQQDTCLHRAARKGRYQTINFVASFPAARRQLNAKDYFDRTPLLLAASESGEAFTKTVDLLLALGSPTDGRNGDGNTALHLAAEANNAATIQLLMERQPDLEKTVNKIGKTPLAHAAYRGKLDAVLTLDQASASSSPRPWLPDLIDALSRDDKDSAELAKALKHYASQITPAACNNALFSAVSAGQIKAARVLLDAGANPDADTRFLPLRVAASVEMAELLVLKGAQINHPDQAGRTVLLETTSKDQVELVSWLLTHGATPNVRDKAGLNALDYARLTGLRGIIATVEKAGGTSSRPSPVLWATDVDGVQVEDGFASPPLVVGDLLVIGHNNGILYAFDRRTGQLRWQRDLGRSIRNELRVLDGDLFVSSDSRILFRLRPNDGTIVWHYAFDGGPTSSGAWPWKNLALIADDSGSLHAVDRQTGQLRWKKNLGSPLARTVTGEDAIRLDGNGLYFLTETGLSRFDLVTEKTVHFEASQAGMPEIAESLAFLPSKEQHLYVLDAQTLELKQDVRLEDQSLLRPLYREKRIYLPLRNKLLAFPLRPKWLRALSLDPLGSPDWQKEITGDLYARPVWANGRIYSFRETTTAEIQHGYYPLADFFATAHLISLDPATGKETSSLSQPLFRNRVLTPAIADDTVYVLPLDSGKRVIAVEIYPR